MMTMPIPPRRAIATRIQVPTPERFSEADFSGCVAGISGLRAVCGLTAGGGAASVLAAVPDGPEGGALPGVFPAVSTAAVLAAAAAALSLSLLLESFCGLEAACAGFLLAELFFFEATFFTALFSGSGAAGCAVAGGVSAAG
jgi:hypothetical protein